MIITVIINQINFQFIEQYIQQIQHQAKKNVVFILVESLSASL